MKVLSDSEKVFVERERSSSVNAGSLEVWGSREVSVSVSHVRFEALRHTVLAGNRGKSPQSLPLHMFDGEPYQP
jgi:hypothetical protein